MTTAAARVYAGGCHCGALGYRYHTAIPPPDWRLRECQCGFCRRHAALTTSDPAGRLAFFLRGGAPLLRYRFGLRTADFLACAGCGLYAGAQIRTPQGVFGLCNLRLLADPPADLPAAVPAVYEAENEAARLARRAERWTPLTAPL